MNVVKVGIFILSTAGAVATAALRTLSTGYMIADENHHRRQDTREIKKRKKRGKGNKAMQTAR